VKQHVRERSSVREKSTRGRKSMEVSFFNFCDGRAAERKKGA
jgi:hypothetical protein